MKRTFTDMNPSSKADKPEKRMKGNFSGDPRLPPRIRQYLEDNRSKPAISVAIMSDDLQARYSDYSRKKRIAFRKSVEKAYEFLMRSTNEDQIKKEADEGVADGSGGSDSFSDDNPEYATYEDKNAMNSLMRNFYMKPGSRPNSRPGSRPTSQPGSGANSPMGGRSPFRPSDIESAPTPLFTIDRSGSKSVTEAASKPKSSHSSPKPKLYKPGLPERQTPLSKRKIDVVDLSNDDETTLKEGMTAESQVNTTNASDDTKTAPVVSEKIENKISSKNDAKTDDAVRTTSKKRRKQEPEESKRKGPDVTQSKVTFADVGGNDKMLAEVCRLLIHLKHPEVYRTLGVTPPRGFLLHGPPGCGKTLLAHAIAGELELPFIKVAATEIVSGVSGESEEKVRDVFQKAVLNAPCVLFIDEIDSISQKRENASKDMERRIVSQLLTCMDELNNAEAAHVLVIGATNRPDSLDPALRRAGRFDREISLGIPDKAARERILRVLCRELRLCSDLDFPNLASLTPGFVGADLMALAREAAITAVNRVFKSLQSHQTKDPATLPVDENMDTGSTTVAMITDGERDIRIEKKPEIDKANLKSVSEIVLESPVLSSPPLSTTCIENNQSKIPCVEKMEITENELKLGGDKLSLETQPIVTDGEQESALAGIESPLPEVSGSKAEDRQDENEFMKGLEKSVSHEVLEEADLPTVLGWLKEQPPLTDDQLKDLRIEMADFEVALRSIQPSAKREGFATIPDVSWSDIGALQDVREELQMAILAPVRHPDQFHALGLTSPPGILLAGPPGCGKTLLAKAVANESGINFISVKGPELLNMYVGESERAVRQVFQRARNSSPCVIFFDELDALCPKRSGSGEGGSSVRVVNQLLTEMDGLEERKQVFIMGATNRPDIIDPAILRPGRLDKTLYVGLPSSSDRLDILRTITKNGTRPKLHDDVDLHLIASHQHCEGYTGADLAALVREAAVTALREFMSSPDKCNEVIIVALRHFEAAFVKVRPSVTEIDKKKYDSMRTRLLA